METNIANDKILSLTLFSALNANSKKGFVPLSAIVQWMANPNKSVKPFISQMWNLI